MSGLAPVPLPPQPSGDDVLTTALLNRSISVRSRAVDVDDEYNNQTTSDTVTPTLGAFWPSSSSDNADGARTVETWSGLLPLDVDLETGDAVDVDGETFEVTGKPVRQYNPRSGAFSHWEFDAERVS